MSGLIMVQAARCKGTVSNRIHTAKYIQFVGDMIIHVLSVNLLPSFKKTGKRLFKHRPGAERIKRESGFGNTGIIPYLVSVQDDSYEGDIGLSFHDGACFFGKIPGRPCLTRKKFSRQ